MGVKMSRKITCLFMLFGFIFFVALFSFRSIEAHGKSSYKTQEEVEVISNPKTPLPQKGMRKKLVFKEELTIGEIEGDENYMFGELVLFSADEEGNIYVTDWDKKRIQKYNSDGKFLLTIGRKGQGPGEFGNLSPARFDKDNNIYVTDIVNQRISFFDKEGNYLKQIKLPDVFEDLYVNSRGYFVSSSSQRLDDETSFGWKMVFGLFDDQFNLVSEFYSEEHRTKPPTGRDLASRAKFLARILSSIAFQPRARHILADDDFIYFGYPDKYEIDVYSPEGIKVRTIQRKFDPIKLTEKDKEYFVQNIGERFMRGNPEDMRKETIRFIEYPKYKPAYHSFTLMDNGWLVVVVEFVENEYTLFDLFDKNGRYIGHFKAEVPAQWLFFKNGKAYTVATEDGYKFVKRYNVGIQDY